MRSGWLADTGAIAVAFGFLLWIIGIVSVFWVAIREIFGTVQQRSKRTTGQRRR